MIIVYCEKSIGWSPISYMVRLAAKLLEAELIVLEYKEPSIATKLSVLISKRAVKSKGEKLLLICPSPTDLSLLFQIKDFRRRFDYIAAWVIDSFWLDRIPKFVAVSGFFDHFFITSGEDVDEWCRLTKTPTSWLPWGTDVLNLGGGTAERCWDLIRVGRQPDGWADDEVTYKSCVNNNISFSGRPSLTDDPLQNHKSLMEVYQQVKFVLAFSNLDNPTNYTHPTRAYLTARWVDTLACGGIVAGISPDEPSVKELLWEGATLELGTVERENGMLTIKNAIAEWRPELADYNYKQSLKKLDWRWRFIEISRFFDIAPDTLLLDVRHLESKIKAFKP